MIDGELMKLRDRAKNKVDFFKCTDDFLVEFVFNSLSFDNFITNKEDVIKVLNNDTKDVDEQVILLVNNQKNGLLKIFEMVNENQPMNENNLKDLHQIIMNGFSDIGGLYRNVDISVKGSNHTPPSHIKVYDRMKKYFDFTEEDPTNNLLEYISYCHLQLAKIHPFLDGNGRTSRLVLNYQLLKHGFMPVIIKRSQFNTYFDCLEEFKVNKNIRPFVRFLEDLETTALEKVLD
ncbi:MAG: Fic family protein [Bacilli bacterium]